MSDHYQNELTGARRDAMWRGLERMRQRERARAERRKLELQMVRPRCNDQLEAEGEARRERFARDAREWAAAMAGAATCFVLLGLVILVMVWLESCGM